MPARCTGPSLGAVPTRSFTWGRSPGHVTFESNVMSSWNVLEAATRLGLESVVLASSINVMGAAHQDAPTHVEYLPVDEAHPLTPRDPYALGKHAIEVIADGYGRRPDAPTVSSLRYPWVATSDELRAEFVENDRSLAGLEAAWHHTTRDTLLSYLHVEDGVAVARLAAEADHDGHESFWAVAADTASYAGHATGGVRSASVGVSTRASTECGTPFTRVRDSPASFCRRGRSSPHAV